MAELTLKNVGKSFDGQPVVERFDLTVANGEFLVLLGPSGCGKSTLLRIVAGLEAADEGEILIDGKNVVNLRPRERDVAMVFQNYALYPHMTVFDNIAFPLKMKRMKRERIRREVQQAAGLLGLTEMLTRKPKTLSGGQRQRVALGRALVRNPKLFLFDEPLSNLDAKLRVSMRGEILRVMQSLKATVVYVTHDQEEALSMGDRIAVLNDRIIQQVGTPEEIYQCPANTFVARFIGTPRMNVLEAGVNDNSEVVLSGDVVVSGIDPTSFSGRSKLVVGFRPDECSISDHDGIPITVESSQYVGGSRYIHGRFEDEEIIVSVEAAADVKRGSSVRVDIPLPSIHLFDDLGSRIETG